MSARYPRGDYDSLESGEDGFNGDGGIHAAEPEDGVLDGGSAVVEGFYYQRESCERIEAILTIMAIADIRLTLPHLVTVSSFHVVVKREI